uniref:Secreted protein n=1 Tax=Mus musculus TaxID=10090 RepID=Q3TNV7_MOUSE|nr:unnamed protein product [Mus musculus]BAE37980.1 unnamed protein product [Mus musculus]
MFFFLNRLAPALLLPPSSVHSARPHSLRPWQLHPLSPCYSFCLSHGRKYWWLGLHAALSLSPLLSCWHVMVALCVLLLFPFTNRRRPNWSMPALRSLNRACSLKRPKLTNSRGS